jgi:hypothetical protein
MREHPHKSDRTDRLTEQSPIDVFRRAQSFLEAAAGPLEVADVSEPDKTASPSTSTHLEAPAQAELIDFLIDLLREVGTGLWRLRQRMVEPESGQARDEMRRAYRQLENLWDTLAQAGLRIHDHTGEQIPEYGATALKIIAYEPAPEAAHGFVVETVKPTIYFMDQMIQMGETIVGAPPKSS